MVVIQKIISGGQTGVDRAGLDAAIEFGLPVGGVCPKDRKAEDGPIPDLYSLTELSSSSYAVRTERNVKDSDGTLVLNIGNLSGGTAKTAEYARRHGKPYLIVQLDHTSTPDTVLTWLEQNQIKILNIAGPRESKHPGLHKKARTFLCQLFTLCKPASDVVYSIEEESLVIPKDTPPSKWGGTWTHNEPYKPSAGREDGLIVPWEQINPDTLRNMVSEFVTRGWSELTDTGYTHDDKVEQVIFQLHQEKACIVFDLISKTCNVSPIEK